MTFFIIGYIFSKLCFVGIVGKVFEVSHGLDFSCYSVVECQHPSPMSLICVNLIISLIRRTIYGPYLEIIMTISLTHTHNHF